MKQKFIIDEEISLKKGDDFLNTKIYADALHSIVKEAPIHKAFTVGLFGEWGSGKSSIIKTVKEKYEEENTKSIFITFDAWKYGDDAFRRSFIVSLEKSLGVTLDKREHNLYTNITEKIDHLSPKKIPKSFWLMTSGIIIALISLYIFCPFVKKYLLALIAITGTTLTITAIIGLVINILKNDTIGKFLNFLKSLVSIKYDSEKPLMFSAEQFAHAFETLINKAGEKYEKIIIVVDNIDRCDRTIAKELLGTIKGFLESNETVLFILPVDEDALKTHINNSSTKKHNEADEYLRKFFTVTLKIKPFQSEQIFDFAKKINNKYSLNFSNETIDLIAKEYATNPRRIIQIFNNLLAELMCFNDKDFKKENETVICKLLILREEFPEYYQALSKNPYLLNKPDERINALIQSHGEKGIEQFLNKTRLITENTSYETLSKIFSNSDVFNEIPQEIIDKIDALEINEIIKFIDGDKHKEDLIITYLINQLEVYKKRQSIGNSYNNYLDVLIELNKGKRFENSVNLRIENVIGADLPFTLSTKNSIHNLIDYSKILQIENKNYLINAIVNAINIGVKNKPDNPEPKWISDFNHVIESFDDINTLERLKESFDIIYNSDEKIIIDNLKTKNQFETFINEEFKQKVVKNIDNISPPDDYCQELIYLFKHTNSTHDTETELIKKLNQIYPDFNSKTKKDISSILENINLFLELFHTDFSKGNEELRKVFDLVTKNRTIPDPNNSTYSQYNLTVNYVDESVKTNTNIKEIVTFCMEIYRLCVGKIPIKSVLNKLSNNEINRDYLDDNILNLIKKGVVISTLFEFIISTDRFTSHSLELIYYALTYKNGSEYVTNEIDLVKTLKNILTKIFDEEDSDKLLDTFLIGSIMDERIKKALSTLICEEDQENILKLSSPLQALALDTIIEGDNIFKYEDNMGFLSVIAKTGKPSHIQKLVRVISSKLQKESTLLEAVELINQLKRVNQHDGNKLLEELKSYKDLDEYKDQVISTKDYLKTIIDNKS